ncbi:MAG TPA: hypothetical protein EYH01_09315 [Campylobacterales bacterium]|nr:hypothetical protein [Campylobacterales bacterium]
MKRLAFLSLLPLVMVAGEFERKGNIGFEVQYLGHDIDNKRDNALALRFEMEVKKEVGDGVFVAYVKKVFDKDDKERRYIDFNDLYYQHNFEDSDILIGRNTRFWGALEFYNLTDVFNTKDFLDDPFDYDSKLGSWNIAYTKYLDNSEISLIVKLHEEKQRIQDSESVNNFFPLPFDDDLKTQKDENRPTLFLKYSGSGDEVQVDYGLVYQNGYDAQRYISMENGTLRQNAYIVNKLMGYATYIHEDTIYKTELAYAISDDDKVSDYGELGVGLEHTLYGFWDKRDLGLLAEYYRYEAKDDDKVDFSKFFADDLTLGFRLSMNDLSSSQVLGGLDIDLDTKEKIFFVEYDTRVWEKYKLKASFTHLAPEEGSVFEELDKVKLEFGYYF